MQWSKADYIVSTNPEDQDIDVIHGFLSQSYWARNIPRETVARSLQGALCFALLHKGRQIGFARVISDSATIAYLGDVFVLPEYRERGLAGWLLELDDMPGVQALCDHLAPLLYVPVAPLALAEVLDLDAVPELQADPARLNRHLCAIGAALREG